MTLRAAVVLELRGHGLGAEGTPADLRELLNDRYLEQVRQLRERQRRGEIALRDYASHVEALKQRFALLGLPLELWTE